MAGSKPPPQTLGPDDERKIQVFLERASSILLQHPEVDAVRWRSLVALADELGLSEQQLRSTVEDLQQRGVISKVDVSTPKPPPLPNRDAGDAEAGSAGSVADSNFALTPPPAAKSAATPEPPPPPPPSKPAVTSPESSRAAETNDFANYMQRAAEIIAEQRGFGPRTQPLLAAAAREMGLADDVVSRAIQQLRGKVGAEPPSAELPTDSMQRRRWREEGQPAPKPPPPSRKPEEIFRAYLQSSFAKRKSGELPAEHEAKLIRHGTHIIGLAEVFAKHLVVEEAEEWGLRRESSHGDDTGQADEDDTSPDLQVFLERAVPILAQHRGINAKSRVLLNALARELGLSEEEVEQAIALAQFRAATSGEEAEAKQLERLEAFHALARGTVMSLPRKFLTADVERDLLRLADERYGLDAEIAKTAIREICIDLEIRQISQQQAREHIEQLVDAKLADDTRLAKETRLRIQTEGDQWGLDAQQVDAIIKERQHEHDRRQRSQRRLANGAQFAASLAVLIVAGLFGWMWASRQPAVAPVETVGEQPIPPATAAAEAAKYDASWLEDDIKLLVIARRNLDGHKQAFEQVESTDPNVRRAAYADLVALLLDGPVGAADRRTLQALLAACYAKEPDDVSARRIASELMDKLPRPDSRLAKDEEVYAAMIRAARTTAVLIAQSADERQTIATADFGRVIGRAVDARLQEMELQQRCVEALAERVFEMLLETARAQPAAVASFQKVTYDKLAGYLEPSRLEKLTTEFLVTVLTRANESWREYEHLIEATILTGTSLNVARLLNVYEKTKNSALQRFMAEPLLTRAGVVPEALEVEVVAGQVRKALGVGEVVETDERAGRFLEGANRVLAAVSADPDDSEELIAEAVRLAYHSTLGCAVSVGARGDATFDALLEQDADSLLDPEEPTAVMRDDDPGLEPSTLQFLEGRLRMIANPRTSSVSRARFIEALANLIDRVKDVTPRQAELLAGYFLRAKRVEEHRVLVEHVPTLRRWKTLRLAVADQLDEASITREQLQELASGLLGEEYELSNGEAGREALRTELLRNVLHEAARDEAEDHAKFELFDRAAAALYDLYARQATNLQVPEWETEPETPTAVLPAMIEDLASKVKSGKLQPSEAKLLARLVAELRAIDYAATNDLQRLALLERIWLQLLAIDVKQERPELQAEVSEVVAKVSASDRDSANVVEQLRSGQAAILRVWVLRNQME